MTDLRRDPFSGSWTLIAAGRAGRPRDHAYPPATPGEPLPGCPFCPGNEDKTPPEIDRTEGGGKGGWLLRAIPNLYPAIEADALSDEKTEGLLQSMSGGGRHEVIIDSPDHLRGLADLPDAHSGKVLAALQRRVRELYRIPSVRAAAPFKNHGATAGASLEHSHLQIIGAPVLPPAVALEQQIAERFHRETGRALLEEVIETELAQKDRILEAGESGAVAWCPFASRFPYQITISPWPARESFADSPPEALDAAGATFARSLRRIKNLLGDPPLNVFFHLETRDAETPAAHRWRIEIMPRLSVVAGLELGAGMHINETAPEAAAVFLMKTNT